MWEKPHRKLLDRATAWGAAGLSLYYAISLYNIYLWPICAFVAQLEPLPKGFEKIEAKALRNITKGPLWWATKRIRGFREGDQVPR